MSYRVYIVYKGKEVLEESSNCCTLGTTSHSVVISLRFIKKKRKQPKTENGGNQVLENFLPNFIMWAIPSPHLHPFPASHSLCYSPVFVPKSQSLTWILPCEDFMWITHLLMQCRQVSVRVSTPSSRPGFSPHTLPSSLTLSPFLAANPCHLQGGYKVLSILSSLLHLTLQFHTNCSDLSFSCSKSQ